MFKYKIISQEVLERKDKEIKSLQMKLEVSQTETKERDLMIQEILAPRAAINKREQELKRVMPDLFEDIPADSNRRREYMSRVGGFYVDILSKKLNQMISGVHTLLEDSELPAPVISALQGTVYAFRELHRWGSESLTEYKGDLVELREQRSDGDNKTAVERIKDLLV